MFLFDTILTFITLKCICKVWTSGNIHNFIDHRALESILKQDDVLGKLFRNLQSYPTSLYY